MDQAASAGIRPFEGKAHVMYSEIMGGNDSVKLAPGDDYYRSHIHGVQKIDGSHTDLMQGQGDVDNLFIAESTLDGLFRLTNATVFFGGNEAIYGDVDIVGNLISGGSNSLRISSKISVITDLIVWNNTFLADASHTSWGLDATNGSFPVGGSGGTVTWGEGNTALGGLTSGVDQLGRPGTWTPPTPSRSRSRRRIASTRASPCWRPGPTSCAPR